LVRDIDFIERENRYTETKTKALDSLSSAASPPIPLALRFGFLPRK